MLKMLHCLVRWYVMCVLLYAIWVQRKTNRLDLYDQLGVTQKIAIVYLDPEAVFPSLSRHAFTLVKTRRFLEHKQVPVLNHCVSALKTTQLVSSLPCKPPEKKKDNRIIELPRRAHNLLPFNLMSNCLRGLTAGSCDLSGWFDTHHHVMTVGKMQC